MKTESFRLSANYNTTVMRYRLFFLLLSTTLLWMSFSPASTKVDFFSGNINTVKDRAAIEGKLYFVDFTASWCMPCRWMDETTFSDPAVAKYIEDNYIAVKVDIDDFDGYAYKQIHNIKLLPSILIFDSKGKEVARYEESLSANRFIDILKKHNTLANRVKTKTNTNYSSSSTSPKPKKQVITRPPLTKTNTANNTTYSTSSSTTNSSSYQPASAAPIMTGDGLYRFKVSRQPSAGYSVQIGVFAEYGNVLTEAARLEDMFDNPVIVHIAKLGDKTVYKVLIGDFNTKDEAIQFRAVVKSKGIESFIKDLSVMG